MSRKRLTKRMQAVEDSIPYPGTVNQPERKFKTRDEYDNWNEVVNHPLPDMRHEWKNDERDDIGFGIPQNEGGVTVASVRVAANKAVRMAVLLLGEKVPEEVVEDQARDFMGMSQDSMDRTLARFAETQTFYAEDDENDEEAKDEESKDASEKLVKDSGGTKPALPGVDQPGDGDKNASDDGDEDDVDGDSDKEASDESKEDGAKDDESKEETASDEESKDDESKEAADDKDEEAKDEESKEATDESKKAEDDEESKDDESKEETASEKLTGPNEMDIELTGSADIVGDDPEADAQLASLYEDENAVAAAELEKTRKTEASDKAGIKKLGGQPKVASQGAPAADISSIWQSAPDVSEIFS